MNRKLRKKVDMFWTTEVNLKSIYCPQWDQIFFLLNDAKKCDTEAKEIYRNGEQWQRYNCVL